jgi:hypothetical protein
MLGGLPRPGFRRKRHFNKETTMNKKLFTLERFSTARNAAFAVLIFSCVGVQAQVRNPSFSADQVQVMGKRTTTSKVYSSEKAVRIEKEEKGKQSITIMHLDRKAVWVLNPDQKTYMDMGGIGAAGAEMASSMEGAKVQRDPLGSEQVGAYHCDKYHVETTLDGHVYKSLEWDAKELGGFPVKQADEKGSWSKEYQNVKLGPQDPSLFEVPAGYKKLDLGGLFGNR